MSPHLVIVALAVVGVLNLIVAVASQVTSWRLVAAMKRHDCALWEREAGLHWLFGGPNLLTSSFLWRRGYLVSSSQHVRALGVQARSLFILAVAGWLLFMALFIVFTTLDSATRPPL